MNSWKVRFVIVGCLLSGFGPLGLADTLSFDQVQSGTISSAAQSNSYTFTANANDVINFTVVTTSGKFSPSINIYSPAGSNFAGNYSGNPFACNGGGVVGLNTVTLATAGTYTIIIQDCNLTGTGSYVMFLQRTNQPVGAVSLPFGQPLSGNISSTAQTNSYTFSATANDVINFNVVTVDGNISPSINLYNPAGATVTGNYSGNPFACNGGGTVGLNTVTLPKTGTYTIIVGDCFVKGTGDYTMFLQRTNNPAGAAALNFGGQPQAGTIDSIAQVNSYTFSATAKDVVNFTIVTTSGKFSPSINVYNPTGSNIAGNYSGNPFACNGGGNLTLNNVTIPVTGTFAVLITDCFSKDSGTYVISAQCIGVCSNGSALQPQTITFPALSNQLLGAAPFALTATASSGLAVTLVSNTTSVCTVLGSVVTLVAVGTCSITASQTGSSSYAAAAPVTQTFMISAGTGPVYDAAADFEQGWITKSNPNGVWSYGYSSGFTNPVTLYTQTEQGPLNGPNAQFWLSPSVNNKESPAAEFNNGPVYSDGNVNFLANQFVLVAGIGGQYSDLIFTAPADGVYSVVTSFRGDQTGIGTVVGVVVNGSVIFNSSVTANGQTVPFQSEVSLEAGNTIVFSAGPGGGAQNTGLSATVTKLSAGSCDYTLAPGAQLIPATAGSGTLGVLTADGCPWSAVSAASFLTITSGSSGTGSGVVQFSVTANSAAATRTGTLTVGGQTATINQTGTAPVLLLNPSSTAVQWRQQGPLPTPIALSVFTAASSLNFTAKATSTGNWLSVSPTSGTAPATVIVTVNPATLQPGSYQGNVTISAPTANPSSQAFNVSLTVVAAPQPTLNVTTNSLSYSFPQGTRQVQMQRILIGNSGGGTLNYNAAASTNSGGNWLSVAQDGAGVTALAPDPLAVNVDPSGLDAGTYTGLITVTSGSASQTIPVTATVSAVQQTILLSQAGLTFTAVVNGGAVPQQTFGVLNSGAGVMDWAVSATTITGGNWLSVTPTSGSTDASSLTVPLVTVSVNPAGLTPGQYSGLIAVTSKTANNSAQYVSIILNVLPAGSNPGPIVLPTGLIFAQAVGGSAAAPQTVALANLTASQETFATGRLTIDGATWFSVTPATGTASPTQASTLTVSVSSAGLTPAIRQGVLTVLFQDGSSRTVNILFLLAAAGGSGGPAGSFHELAAGGVCTPTKLLPLITSLGSQFTVPAAWPNTLSTQVVDDCGNPQIKGTVTATFSNGDAPLPLISLKNGMWTGTWQVTKHTSSAVSVTVNADDPVLSISGATSVSGNLQSSASAPVLNAGSVYNAASYAPSAPVAPGTIISMYGSNLANGQSTASTLPLPSQLGGTLVTIGGKAAPLLYADTGQINAIVPYGLPVNTTSQIIIRQGDSYTSPQSIVVAPSAPGIFSFSPPSVSQGVIVRPDGNFAEPGTPAQAGDAIVIYAGGLGNTTPNATAGQAATASPLLTVAAPVSVTIGGQNAEVLFAGLTPGLAGLYQVAAIVPGGVHGNVVPVVVTVSGQPSPAATMAVQ